MRFVFVLFVALGIFLLLWRRDIREKKQLSMFVSQTTDVLSAEMTWVRKNWLADVVITQHQCKQLMHQLTQHIVGMEAYRHGLLVALLAGGHVLVEGVPWLAKTKTITLLAQLIALSFHRIQFTPDMLPWDIVGTEIYDTQKQQFVIVPGPLFAHCILADEINRTTPKVQSALLEAMQESQVTISGKTFPLAQPFFVLATQNPLEHEGTYPLPEAQIDRFMMQIVVTYPDYQQEQMIVKQHHTDHSELSPLVTKEWLLAMQSAVQQIKASDTLIAYAVRLVQATRSHTEHFRLWASPRASLALIEAAKAIARLRGAAEITISDIQCIALPVLRHRVKLSFASMRQGKIIDDQLLAVLTNVSLFGE